LAFTGHVAFGGGIYGIALASLYSVLMNSEHYSLAHYFNMMRTLEYETIKYSLVDHHSTTIEEDFKHHQS